MPTARHRRTSTRRRTPAARRPRRAARTRSTPSSKARGGSPASTRVESLVPKQCTAFVNPSPAATMQPIRADYGGYAIQAGGGDAVAATGTASAAGAGASAGGSAASAASTDTLSGSCSNTSSFIPHDSDSYYRWRGNEGDSNVFGTSVPSNAFQNTSDWFNGKSTLLTPSKFDAGVQDKARYFTDSGKGALTGMPSMKNMSVEVPTGVEGPNTQMAAAFEAPYTSTRSESHDVPLFRAGGRKARRRPRRHARKSTHRRRRR